MYVKKCNLFHHVCYVSEKGSNNQTRITRVRIMAHLSLNLKPLVKTH